MNIGKTNANYSYYMNGNTLQYMVEEKDFGIFVTPDSSPTLHISKAAVKTNSKLGRIKQNFHMNG